MTIIEALNAELEAAGTDLEATLRTLTDTDGPTDTLVDLVGYKAGFLAGLARATTTVARGLR